MSLIVIVEEQEGYITRNGVTTFEPELWAMLTDMPDEIFNQLEEDD